MSLELEKFFKIDENAFYTNNCGQKYFRGVSHPTDKVRNDKADEQAKRSPVSFDDVFSYVNDFLELVKTDNGHKEKNEKSGLIELDNLQQEILNNCIVAKNCNWAAPIWDEKKCQHTFWDPKYDVIKDKFNLKNSKDIIWLKFTKKGHLGVVAKSFDINYNRGNSSGILVSQVKDEWDISFVFIVPLTPSILGKRKSGDMELAIGNYLISKEVPIIDYYSHNN